MGSKSVETIESYSGINTYLYTMKKDRKEPLYRKENKASLSCRYYVSTGGDAKWDRNTKQAKKDADDEISHQPIKTKSYNRGASTAFSSKSNGLGRDYTPLFKFLLSKVGKKWDEVYSEAKSRLDSEEPIFWMVKFDPIDQDGFRAGESTYYSTLTVDKDGILVKVNENMIPWKPGCECCTHSVNGQAITKNTIVRDYVTKEVGRWGDFLNPKK